ncbi:MAG: DegV family protein, partial [Coriobacteriales bacterium]|nr:DegV family protein [Coriobacteriales bacterium]
GTVQSATIAAAESPIPVRVVDTKLVSQASGLVLKSAIAARDAGATAQEVERVAVETAAETRIFFVLDTLEYLVKGGRAGKATGLAASLLDIKPVLTFTPEGEVEPFARVKGQKKAYAQLAEHVAKDAAENGRMRLALLHACDESRVAALRAAIDTAGADVEFESTGLVGAVIGTYAGPGAVGVGYHPMR